jgi:hypothetical protein
MLSAEAERQTGQPVMRESSGPPKNFDEVPTVAVPLLKQTAWQLRQSAVSASSQWNQKWRRDLTRQSAP